jgi:phosphohistidine phosphatase SixA
MRDGRRRAVLAGAVLLVALATLAAPSPAAADERMWSLVTGGGQAIFVRHAITTPGVGDPPNMRLSECSTQRNLTDEGRGHARRIGEAFRARGVPVARILSSPWCRCLETARLAFGPPEPWAPLGNLFGRPENRAEQVQALQALASERRTGGNIVLVTHGSTIAALTGIHPGTGEMVVVSPQESGRFVVAGRLAVR